MVTSSGSSLSSILVTLREPGKGRSVEVAFDTSFEQMVSEHAVPVELQGAANQGWRRLVEEATFETICDKAEPSLARLLSSDERLRRLPGVPEMPQNYALYVEPPAPLSRTGSSTWAGITSGHGAGERPFEIALNRDSSGYSSASLLNEIPMVWMNLQAATRSSESRRIWRISAVAFFRSPRPRGFVKLSQQYRRCCASDSAHTRSN